MKRHTKADASEEDGQGESSAAILGSPPEGGEGDSFPAMYVRRPRTAAGPAEWRKQVASVFENRVIRREGLIAFHPLFERDWGRAKNTEI